MSTLEEVFALYGFLDSEGVMWRLGEGWEANLLLARHHYLGPLKSGGALTVIGARDGALVAAMVWKMPTNRHLPADGTWLELARWCLTPGAGENAGSRMHKWACRLIRSHMNRVTTLISYSDPSQGHTGSLYRACNWEWAPTWLRLRPPPTGQGDWGTGRQEVKDRWIFCLKPDATRHDVLTVRDLASVRYWREHGSDAERGWASRSRFMEAAA